MKKFLNDPATFVKEMIEGINLANPGKYIYKPEFNILARNDIPADKVAIMQGSGSGHEPPTSCAWARACWTPPARQRIRGAAHGLRV